MTNRRCSCTVPLHYTSGWDQGTIEHEVKCKATEMGPRTMPWCLSGLTFIDSIHTEDSTLGRGSPDACGCATVRYVGVSLAPEKAAVGTHYRHRSSDSDAETQRVHERVMCMWLFPRVIIPVQIPQQADANRVRRGTTRNFLLACIHIFSSSNLFNQ